MELIDWDDYFLMLAKSVSKKSKDNSSQIGAIIVGPDKEIRSTGYNGAPRGFDDDSELLLKRPEKYTYMEHAERNAIYNAARFGARLEGCTLYCEWPPCTQCARAIIQSGIVEVVNAVLICDCPDRWMQDFYTAHNMLIDCGVRRRTHESR